MAQKYAPDAFITKSGFLIRWVESLRLRRTRTALDLKSDHHVLDVGCGAGNLLAMLQGARLVGVDLAESLLKEARERLKGRPNVQLYKANIEALPFPDRTFDRVVCSEVLEHALRPEAILAEMRRVAKPGARVVITVPNEDLINWTKRLILKLGLKKFVAGQYPMSDNMLEEWHLNEISPRWVRKRSQPYFDFAASSGIPWPFLAYHRIFTFVVPHSVP